METVHLEQKVLKVLIYHASAEMVPLICHFLLRFTSSKIQFLFLETDRTRYKQAEQHCEEVGRYGSKMLIGVTLKKHPKTAFRKIDCAIILPPNLAEDSSKQTDGHHYIYIGRVLEEYAPRSIRVIFFSWRHVNVLCMATSYFCPSLNPFHITGVSYHHVLRARHILAEKIGCASHRIRNVFVWGADRVDLKEAYLEHENETAPNLQGHCAIQRIYLDEDFLESTTSLESEDTKSSTFQEKRPSSKFGFSQANSSSKSSVTNSKTISNDSSRIQSLKPKLNPSYESILPQCDFDPGLHCTDIVPIAHEFRTYSYDLWDVPCPEAKYSSKYCDVFKNEETEKYNCKQKKNMDSLRQCTLKEKDKKIADVIEDYDWIKTDLVKKVQELNRSSDIVTFAYAISIHFNAIMHGCQLPLSMVVKPDGFFNIHDAVYFSLPVRIVDGEVKVAMDISADSMTQSYIHNKSSALMRFAASMPNPVVFNSKSRDIQQRFTSFDLEERSEDDIISITPSEFSYVSGVEDLGKKK